MESVDRERTIRMLSDLVRIDSINPSLDPNGCGEREIAWYVAEQLCVAGIEVSFREPAPGRVSTIARLPGTRSGPTLVLNAHIDTVGVTGMADPFGATVRDGRLHGRGAYDMKGSLAACMTAMALLARRHHERAGDVVLHAVADEEHSSIGAYDLVAQHPIDAAIVTEPTALQICEAHKGFIWLEVETLGRAAHGSQFELGIDANVLMGRFLVAFDDLVRSLRARQPHRLLGPPSAHAATLNGGSGLSTYAASCRLGIERRTLPNELPAEVIGEVRRLIDTLTGSDPTFAAALRVLLERPAFEMRPDSRIARALDAAATHTLGAPPRRIGENPWMDASIYAAAGIDTIVFGVAGGGAHSANEWVEIESVVQLAEILVDTAIAYGDSPC